MLRDFLIQTGSGNCISLICYKISLFRSLGNFAKKPGEHVGFSALDSAKSSKSKKLPVFSLVIREFDAENVAARDVKGEARLQMLHDLFQSQLKSECGLKYVRSFEIITAHRNSGYHLFFGTQHELGLQRMKEAMWRIDPSEGQRFADSTSRNQQMLFEQEPDIESLRRAMIDHFQDKTFSIEDAERFALVDTPYLPSHVKTRTLKPWEERGRLEIVKAKDGRRRGTYPPGTSMRFVG